MRWARTGRAGTAWPRTDSRSAGAGGAGWPTPSWHRTPGARPGVGPRCLRVARRAAHGPAHDDEAAEPVAFVHGLVGADVAHEVDQARFGRGPGAAADVAQIEVVVLVLVPVPDLDGDIVGFRPDVIIELHHQ